MLPELPVDKASFASDYEYIDETGLIGKNCCLGLLDADDLGLSGDAAEEIGRCGQRNLPSQYHDWHLI